MGGNLGSTRAVPANLLQVFFYLLPARTRCVEVLLRVALDLRLTMLAALNLVAQAMQSHGKLGAVHAGRILLRLEETALLKSTGLAILALGHIEDDSMGVELRRCIALNRASSVVLESGDDE